MAPAITAGGELLRLYQFSRSLSIPFSIRGGMQFGGNSAGIVITSNPWRVAPLGI
jgi:hypothetical protein